MADRLELPEAVGGLGERSLGLVESILLFGLDSVEVSEADILHGAALDVASKRP